MRRVASRGSLDAPRAEGYLLGGQGLRARGDAARPARPRGGRVSQVGFFNRLSNLWKGFLSLWISDLEKEHPEIAYENSINGMVAKYQTLKKATAAIIRRREELEERLGKLRSQLAQVDADLETAVDQNQDDLAMVLLNKKNALETEIGEVGTDLEQAKTDGEEAKSSLLNVQAEINKLKAEKDRMLAKMASAQARISRSSGSRPATSPRADSSRR
jgi:phage shock protein A